MLKMKNRQLLLVAKTVEDALEILEVGGQRSVNG